MAENKNTTKKAGSKKGKETVVEQEVAKVEKVTNIEPAEEVINIEPVEEVINIEPAEEVINIEPVEVQNVLTKEENIAEPLGANDVEKIQESLDNIKIEIEHKDPLETIADGLTKQIASIDEIDKKAKEILENNEKLMLAEALATDEPEKSEEILKETIKKVEEIKAEINKKIIETPNKSSKSLNITTWWNGMGYDF